MTTRVDDTGLAYVAAFLATAAVTISAHTGDPAADGSANELPTGGQRNYARKVEPAGNWSADAAVADNDNAIDVFIPTATEAGTVVSHIGIRFGAVWYGRVELIAPVTLVAGRPFRIAAGTIDLMAARPA